MGAGNSSIMTAGIPQDRVPKIMHGRLLHVLPTPIADTSQSRAAQCSTEPTHAMIHESSKLDTAVHGNILLAGIAWQLQCGAFIWLNIRALISCYLCAQSDISAHSFCCTRQQNKLTHKVHKPKHGSPLLLLVGTCYRVTDLQGGCLAPQAAGFPAPQHPSWPPSRAPASAAHCAGWWWGPPGWRGPGPP